MADEDSGLDEDESKIRRNLVWLSSLIVGWWFIGLDLSEVAKKLIGTDKIDHPARVWIVIAVMLYYVVARFWNQEKSTACRNALIGLRRDEIKSSVNKLIGLEWSHSGSGKNLKYIGNKVDNPSNTIHGLLDNPLLLECSFFYRKGRIQISSGGVYEIRTYELPFVRHSWSVFKRVSKLVFWDNETTYFVFPMILWLGAVAITVCNLWKLGRVWLGV
ncbi:hypothetical protein Q9Q94_10260 [Uliginosibacterium sp. 31-16]|uniref:hypothetical protein n=1 Tax=Uliginosibacterium sp. 31-16 TaxID=3068315 RepID=UPI00274000E6|nr:hypothetical protein [Uliginosibacterium sp. 31-16]MDP5239918.1 hypothetical protein [Uliginosibacterium sp. 31-16]